ncbi:tripartite tricarboxylate transporter TctB family protein [Rhodococcus opacus]|uniref:tripartite tricarboxylate transporter TctB family protein n=1 Tax=Rhodococcus opacus TaxID=37919 RepID=UPI00146A855E|nr:tripartite tricarboxylate transporter TctB family protein [Rhodococcus opacus]MDJ0415402.1 tripartite tricarboxylate transporter TctB family protein [Rhodococcus opacus]MDV7090463.1 tripartite tricarboxylate transporter TctB family protein [Rhodococcus opacus]UNN04664.1 tripartite tricarboxylate transporter TctB family protein [Rhodococcus opacus]WKN52464.1 tripartite tricarboxylate transporter TctB family protein [Rhodococcus opacus]
MTPTPFTPETSEPTVQPTASAKFWDGRGALIIPVVLVALGIFLVFGIIDMDGRAGDALFGPKAFPAIVAVACFVVAALLTLSIVRNPERPAAESTLDTEELTATPGSNWSALLITISSFVCFILLLPFLGWIIAAALLFWGISLGLGSRRYLLNLLIGLALSSSIQLIFSGLLDLNVPSGIMGWY